jgi:hypothetical protein
MISSSVPTVKVSLDSRVTSVLRLWNNNLHHWEFNIPKRVVIILMKYTVKILRR